jgi:hypothetical protein
VDRSPANHAPADPRQVGPFAIHIIRSTAQPLLCVQMGLTEVESENPGIANPHWNSERSTSSSLSGRPIVTAAGSI